MTSGGVCWAAQNTAIQACGKSYYFDGLKLYIVRGVLPLGAGRFMHTVVLYGYQGADTDAEQFALTDKLFDAALGELSVPEGSPACWLEISTWSPPKSLACQKGFRLGSGLNLEASWALATGEQPASTCKRSWGSNGGHRRDFMVGCPLAAAAAVLSCTVQTDRWIAPHLAVRTLFDYGRWSCKVTQPVQRTPLWPASW